MRYASVLQRSWDWRAAANFVFGGGGGSLLFCAALFEGSLALRVSATLLGLTLIAAGLTMVWLEIGRPWRAANVMLKPQNSWMTREAYVATLAFVLAGASLLWYGPLLGWATGVSGIAFVYCQARILRASKGIPAWREPTVGALILTTGLTEGIAMLLLLVMALSEVVGNLPNLLLVLLLFRFAAWTLYKTRLFASNPPAPVAAALPTLGRRFVAVGHVLPLLLVVTAYFAPPLNLLGNGAAALLALLAGWHVKFVLVTGLARVQGFGLGELKRGHPLRLAGHKLVSEASSRLRKTRAAGINIEGNSS